MGFVYATYEGGLATSDVGAVLSIAGIFYPLSCSLVCLLQRHSNGVMGYGYPTCLGSRSKSPNLFRPYINPVQHFRPNFSLIQISNGLNKNVNQSNPIGFGLTLSDLLG